jgi:hypothetical protein
MLIIEFQTCLNTKKEQYLRFKLTGKEEIIAAMERFEEQHHNIKNFFQKLIGDS